MADKIKSVSEVVRTIPSGSHIALGGFAIARNLITVVHELIRQQKGDLTLSQGVVGLETDLLVGAGLVGHLIMGGGSLDRFGPAHCVNRARETKSLQLRRLYEPFSLLSLFGRRAGSLLHSHQVVVCFRDLGAIRGRAGRLRFEAIEVSLHRGGVHPVEGAYAGRVLRSCADCGPRRKLSDQRSLLGERGASEGGAPVGCSDGGDCFHRVYPAVA